MQAAKEEARAARLAEQTVSTAVTLSTLGTVDEDQEGLQRMAVIIKADTTGSLEALKGALLGLPQDTVSLRFILAATGAVVESDIDLARTANSLVIAFNTEVSEAAEAVAKQAGVDVSSYNVIYDVLDEVRARMEGKIKAVKEKVPRGTAEVKALFGRGKNINAGCVVTDGQLMKKDSVVEVYRGRKTLVHEGPLSSLRRFKDDVDKVDEGLECGIGCDGFWEWEEGDRVECFELVEKTLTLEESKADVAIDFDEAMTQFEEEYQHSLLVAAGLVTEPDSDEGFW